MSCQICVEVCPFDAIKMDKVFEIAATNRFEGLFLDREKLAKPNSYYHQIHPTEAAEVDARLTAERLAAEEKAKAAAAAKATAAAAKPAAPPAQTAPAPSAVAPSPVAKPQDEPRRSSPSEGGPATPGT
jgi:NADH-quinone oxidoreductase subunit I